MQHKTDEPSDSAIIRSVISGDVNAFEVLIKRYESYVFAIVLKHIPQDRADEVSHNVFIRAFKGIEKFSGENLKKWLAGISVRTCYDFWRKKYRSKEVPVSQLNEAHQKWLENSISDNALESFNENNRHAQALEILDWALGKLSAADRMIVELVYLEGHSHKETGALLGWSVANIKIRAYRAKKKLYKILMAEKDKIRGLHEDI